MADKSLIANHPVNKPVASIIDLAEDDVFQAKMSELDPERRSVIRSAEFFARQLRKQLENVSASEVSISGLNQLNANLNNTFNELNAFKSSGNVGHVTNAGSNLDGALNVASWAFFARPTKGSKIYGESIASVRKASDRTIKAIEVEKNEAKEKLKQLENKISEQEAAIAAANSELDQVKSSSKTRLDEIAAEFARIQSEIEEERREDRTKREGELSDFFQDQSKIAEQKTKDIEGYEAQAKKILQIVGNIGLTGNYQNRATTEKGSADLLRRIAMGFFTLGAGVLAFSVYRSFDGTIDTVELIARAIVALTISAPAIYLAKESARHRTNSDIAKQTELELASLTPFLETLPVERKQQVIESLSNSYFGKSVDEHRVAHPVELSTEQLIKLLIKALESDK